MIPHTPGPGPTSPNMATSEDAAAAEGNGQDLRLTWSQRRWPKTPCIHSATTVMHMENEETCIEVLRAYPNAILALRAAFQDQRLGLVLGAGMSRGFSFAGKHPPQWGELISKLEQEMGFSPSSGYTSLSATQRVDVLFRTFLHQKGISPSDEATALGVRGEWRDLIRKHLYAGAPPAEELIDSHPYLEGLLDIIWKSPFTVTYNFDSYVEEALDCYKSTERIGGGRPYETITDVAVPQRRSNAVLFHINGYLPRSDLDTASDNLVFSEGDFSDQLIMTTAGRYATVSHHLANNVYLLLGLSLDDANLRHMLRTHALSSPGRIHFYVKFTDTNLLGEDATDDVRDRVAESNFDLHNLVTMNLTDTQISALTRLVTVKPYRFGQIARRADIEPLRIYYLSGVPGIGKTTVLRHMGGLRCVDEWMSAPDALLARPFKDLSDEEVAKLDEWVAGQFRAKNLYLSALSEGIVIVERGPLDPLAFVESDGLAAKATTYAEQLEVRQKPIAPGHGIFLHGEPTIISRRIAARQAKKQEAGYLGRLQNQFEHIYGALPEVSSWHSTDWSIEELVKNVARAVYADSYAPADLQARLDQLRGPSS